MEENEMTGIIPRTGWYERKDGGWAFVTDDDREIWARMPERDRKRFVRDYFFMLGGEAFDRLYDGWAYHSFEIEVRDSLHRKGFDEYAEYFGYFWFREGDEVEGAIL